VGASKSVTLLCYLISLYESLNTKIAYYNTYRLLLLNIIDHYGYFKKLDVPDFLNFNKHFTCYIII